MLRGHAAVVARWRARSININDFFLKLNNQGFHTLGNRGLADGEMSPMRWGYALEAHDSPF
jgi:hypothetical protein